jgi:dipeptidase D
MNTDNRTWISGGEQLEPASVWSEFAGLNRIPRPSKKEEQIRAYLKHWFSERAIPFKEDHVGNLLAHKPASLGMEKRVPVVIQAHMDMVCQQNEGTNHDFDSEGINMLVESGWVRARGTTLGADNGMGLAMGLAVFADHNAVHPPLELLITVDEETGMTGALGLQEGWVQGKFLLNIDTEDDRELTVGCAGGVDVTSTGTYSSSPIPAGYRGLSFRLRGLTGGHSGMDIHLGRGNANVLSARVLVALEEAACALVSEWKGGSLRNAIPREAKATIAVANSHWEKALESLSQLKIELIQEYAHTDPSMALEWEEVSVPIKSMDPSVQGRLIRAVASAPNGIVRMSPTISGLVQTSNNVSALHVLPEQATVQCLTRSSVDSEKMATAAALRGQFALAGLQTEFAGSYPGWDPAPAGALASLMRTTYVGLFNEEPMVNACHAGLECGLFKKPYPEMDMVSIGPTIRYPHGPDEMVNIETVGQYWQLLLAVLERIPAKA